MRRWPVLVSFLLFLVLCASVGAWTVQWLKPPARAVAAAPAQETTVTVQLATASTLFGARKPSPAPAGNYALKGVIVMPEGVQGVAIIAVGGKPAQMIRVGSDVEPGVSVKEVHPQFVLLTERGAERRLDLFDRKPSELVAQVGTPPRADDTRPQSGNASVPSEPPSRPAPPRSRRGKAENSAARAPSD